MKPSAPLVALTLLACFVSLSAEETNAGLLKKVETSYDQMKVNADTKAVIQSQRKASTASQKQAYLKEWVLLSKKQHAKTLKVHGPDSELTADAGKRHKDATAAYEDAHEKNLAAQHDLNSDRRDASESKNELTKDQRK